ncbi:hypothetical protein CBW54_03105 [Yersinia kristensenii]|nr:hypothetical protein CBW54_03105 [Yersinia kristensenii]
MLNSPLILIKATELIPCPFCSGPPVTFMRELLSNRPIFVPIDIDLPEDGVFTEVYVFCHECGATSEPIDGIIYSDYDLIPLINEARAKWNLRDKRHIELYQAAYQVNQTNYIDKFFGEKTAC